jgi:hypothetical protein
MRISGAGDVSVGDQSSVANAIRYVDVYNTHNGTASTTGSDLRLITRNNLDSGTSIVDLVKYRNGSFNLANNDTGNANVTTNFILNAVNIMNLSLTSVAIGVTSASTTTTSGALTVAGGAGVAGALCVGGGISAGSGITLGTARLAAPTGSAPMFAARAWAVANWDGSAMTIGNKSSNVTSTVSVNTGTRTVTFNFSPVLPTTDYVVVVGAGRDAGGLTTQSAVTSRTTSSCVVTVESGSGAQVLDATSGRLVYLSIAVFC